MTGDDYQTLQYVHPALSACVILAHGRYRHLRYDRDFRVTSGFRTLAEQQRLVKAGKSKTLQSYHLEGMAVDLAILSRDRSKAFWELSAYKYLNDCMQYAAQQVGIRLTWGGDWIKLRDGVHWQVEDLDATLPRLHS